MCVHLLETAQTAKIDIRHFGSDYRPFEEARDQQRDTKNGTQTHREIGITARC